MGLLAPCSTWGTRPPYLWTWRQGDPVVPPRAPVPILVAFYDTYDLRWGCSCSRPPHGNLAQTPTLNLIIIRSAVLELIRVVSQTRHFHWDSILCTLWKQNIIISSYSYQRNIYKTALQWHWTISRPEHKLCYNIFSVYVYNFAYVMASCYSYVREDNSFPLEDGGMTCVALLSNRPLTETIAVWEGRTVQNLRYKENEMWGRKEVVNGWRKLLRGFWSVQLQHTS
jgi:hypothetical protein